MGHKPIFDHLPKKWGELLKGFAKLIGRIASLVWLLMLLVTFCCNSLLATLIFLAATCSCLTVFYMGQKAIETFKNVTNPLNAGQ
jgi:hypothetical protein